MLSFSIPDRYLVLIHVASPVHLQFFQLAKRVRLAVFQNLANKKLFAG